MSFPCCASRTVVTAAGPHGGERRRGFIRTDTMQSYMQRWTEIICSLLMWIFVRVVIVNVLKHNRRKYAEKNNAEGNA